MLTGNIEKTIPIIQCVRAPNSIGPKINLNSCAPAPDVLHRAWYNRQAVWHRASCFETRVRGAPRLWRFLYRTRRLSLGLYAATL